MTWRSRCAAKLGDQTLDKLDHVILNNHYVFPPILTALKGKWGQEAPSSPLSDVCKAFYTEIHLHPWSLHYDSSEANTPSGLMPRGTDDAVNPNEHGAEPHADAWAVGTFCWTYSCHIRCDLIICSNCWSTTLTVYATEVFKLPTVDITATDHLTHTPPPCLDKTHFQTTFCTWWATHTHARCTTTENTHAMRRGG